MRYSVTMTYTFEVEAEDFLGAMEIAEGKVKYENQEVKSILIVEEDDR